MNNSGVSAEVVDWCRDGIVYRVNDAARKLNPVTSSLIPHSDGQVFFASLWRYIVRVIGSGKGYRLVKGNPFWSEYDVGTNSDGVFRQG